MPSLPPPPYFVLTSGGSYGGSPHSCGSADQVQAAARGATMDAAAAGPIASSMCPVPAPALSVSSSSVATAVAAASTPAFAAAGVGVSFESDDDAHDFDTALDGLGGGGTFDGSDLSTRSDEDLARLFAHMEARRHREEATARLDAERESLRMAMAMQADEETEREQRRREFLADEERGWRAAVALSDGVPGGGTLALAAANDEEVDRRLAARLMREEEEERAAIATQLGMASLSMGRGAGIAGASCGSAAAETAAAAADEANFAAGSTGADVGELSDDTALRLARAIQAQDDMITRRHGADASVELARRLQEQDRCAAAPAPFRALGRGSSRGVGAGGGRPMSDPLPSSYLSEIFAGGHGAGFALDRNDSAANLVRAALHHGPLHLRQEEAWSRLTPRQREAVGYVDCVAQSLHEEATPALRARVLALGYTIVDLEMCLAYIRDDAPIIVHLKERTLEHLCCDPWYRSQFETGTSGGTLDRRRRQRWEDAMFGAAYGAGEDGTPAPDDEHPKYGCLNITGDILGVRGARGYGKLYLTLAPSVRHRTSFSNRDTGQQAGKSKMATNNWYGHVLAEYSDDELRTVFRVSGSVGSRLSGAPSSAFSQYKECQIHGTLSMAADVLALSVPARRADAEGSQLASLVEEFRQISGCTILWQGDLLGE